MNVLPVLPTSLPFLPKIVRVGAGRGPLRLLGIYWRVDGVAIPVATLILAGTLIQYLITGP